MSNTKLSMLDRYEEAINLESLAYEEVEALAADLADAAEPIARIGDGNCGAVIDMVLQALAERGLYRRPGSGPKPAYTKQRIGHALRRQVFERDAYRCVHCGDHMDLTVDHIHPESKGGDLELGNLQTLCRPCNSRKGAK